MTTPNPDRRIGEEKPMNTHQTSEAGEFSKADIDRVANALWDTLCPGIRETEEDVDYYRELARRAIDIVRSPGDPQEVSHLRAQLAEAERERDAAKLEASKTALLRTMLHNHFCTVLGWEKVREMEGNPYMLANAVSHEVWRCKNRELDFTLLTNERDAAQARAGEMEAKLAEYERGKQ